MASSAISSSLRLVALVEWAKGAVALLLAMGMVTAGPVRLQHGLILLTDRLHIGRRHGPFALIDQGIDIGTLDIIAALCGAYALLRAAEGWGLWRQRAWAEWMGIVSAAAYLPLDALGLQRHPGPVSAMALVLNVGLIALLSMSLRRRRRTMTGAA